MAKRLELTDHQKQKKKNGKCVTPFCMKSIVKRRNKKGKYITVGNICESCHKKNYIKNHPLEYTYGVWQNNCKRRKKYNDVTFNEFKIFVGDTDYMRKKGTSAKSLQIDRDKECVPGCPPFCQTHGYTKKNIQAITLRENVYKYAKHRRQQSDEVVPF